MHGKILIIDPIATNRIVLKVKLSAAYYNVTQVSSIKEARAAAENSTPDIVITAGQLPDGDASDLTTQLRSLPDTSDLPIVAIVCTDDHDQRATLLLAGVDAVLCKPLNDEFLLAQVRSLVRSHASNSEWRLRDDTSRALGFAEKQATFLPVGHSFLVASNKAAVTPWVSKMAEFSSAKITISAVDETLNHLDVSDNARVPDVFVLVMDKTEPQQMLHLLSTLKSHTGTRNCGVLIVQTDPDQTLAAQALDMGANDVMTHGFAAQEMVLRINALLKRKQISDQMRATVRTGLEAAVCDPLTGLHNRRYAMPHLERIAKHAHQTDKPFAVMIADMDHFKRINDTYGHAAGDAVLVETAKRLRENLRAVDLVARIGGEEFLIALPGVPLASARTAASRLCKLIRATPFELPGSATPITATISIGLAVGGTATTAPKTAHEMLDEADKALYGAKTRGRDCVTLHRPAA